MPAAAPARSAQPGEENGTASEQERLPFLDALLSHGRKAVFLSKKACLPLVCCVFSSKKARLPFWCAAVSWKKGSVSEQESLPSHQGAAAAAELLEELEVVEGLPGAAEWDKQPVHREHRVAAAAPAGHGLKVRSVKAVR